MWLEETYLDGIPSAMEWAHIMGFADDSEILARDSQTSESGSDATKLDQTPPQSSYELFAYEQ